MTKRELLEQSVAELQQQLERHEQFIRLAFEGGQPHDDGCSWDNCRHKQLLCSLLLEAVQVLDDTRKSFKSKRLEALRKGFEQVLVKEMASPAK